MSVVKRVQQGFLRLPLARKTILLSSGLLMLSPLLPWYDNRNSFGLGDSSIGLRGPLFLVGTFVMIAGGISFLNLFLPLTGKAFFKARKKSGLVAMTTGGIALLMIMVANSVFFHPDFGTAVSQKGTRFGMMAAFASVGLMLASGYWANRKEKNGQMEDIESYGYDASGITEARIESEEMEEVQHYVAPRPVETPVYQNNYQPSQSSVRPLTASTPQYSGGFTGDPLTLDARTRYKMMKQAESLSQEKNYWGTRSNENEVKGNF